MDTQISFGIEETTDGFLAYQLQNPSCYTYGSTEEEAYEAIYTLTHEEREMYTWRSGTKDVKHRMPQSLTMMPFLRATLCFYESRPMVL